MIVVVIVPSRSFLASSSRFALLYHLTIDTDRLLEDNVAGLIVGDTL